MRLIGKKIIEVDLTLLTTNYEKSVVNHSDSLHYKNTKISTSDAKIIISVLNNILNDEAKRSDKS